MFQTKEKSRTWQFSRHPSRSQGRSSERLKKLLRSWASADLHYCRASGIHTRRLSKLVMLHEDDLKRLVEWIRERDAAEEAADNWAGRAPFA